VKALDVERKVQQNSILALYRDPSHTRFSRHGRANRV
jgi:hypothetical protein